MIGSATLPTGDNYYGGIDLGKNKLNLPSWLGASATANVLNSASPYSTRLMVRDLTLLDRPSLLQIAQRLLRQLLSLLRRLLTNQ